ncbi:sensor histidine kinase ResE [Paenibacillus larvae subsp. larvae DSM 25430]|uniref:histidine kinase n=1 Tax=Paenibacillus larvae subsp. larvae DSM 25430 TaxID=697284 RepID=V9WB83_9BACL|nr:sensor histidine kinase ResE [Paenibacillus larvae subsp. larvae DSM 25430]AVG14007.1 sensor histidine kinase ResE [Paenibacillus larvae subsp. larvae DSM 25430]
MRKGIVLKLFLLTTVLCMLILATVFMGQTIFFKQYYANRKVDDIKTGIQSFEQAYLNAGEDVQTIEKLEQNFHREHGTWITTLDSLGNIKHINDFYLEIKLDPSRDKTFSDRVIKIPLYSFMNLKDIQKKKEYITKGARFTIFGIKKDTIIAPWKLLVEGGLFSIENNQLTSRLDGLPQEYFKENTMDLSGKITKVQLLEENAAPNHIYTNHMFIERIKEFQANLILNENNPGFNSLQVLDYEENGIKYKLLIKPIKDQDGTTSYIYAMTSLQPVDEAVQMIKDYYIYLIVFVLLLSGFFLLFKKDCKTFIAYKRHNKKMANLDFSEKIPIKSKDEIGDLSQNINTLSHSLHSHIHQLQQDIEKEKQLENTRKEFIAGVSHELKTPLSIMKSCISILKDGVASHKKEYYFEAMEKEVDKMDMLIVDMLELAKFESGTYKMKMHTFHIDQAIEHICDQLSMEINNKQLNVHKKLSRVKVLANQHRIEQVITNFITNAIRHTPEKETIMIFTAEENERVKVCVKNKGSHIPEEQLDKIWERFYRGDTFRQRSKDGTGLGLAISKNILDLHDVRYGVYNTEDGVLFYFYLNKTV